MSVRKSNPDVELWWLIVDRAGAFTAPPQWGVRTLYVEELGIVDWEFLAFVYTIVEWNTNVKPTFMRWLVENQGADIVTYFDPDIAVYSSIETLKRFHEQSDIMLTPHAMSPVPKDYPYSDRLFLKTGTWNLGFISIVARPSAKKILNWWENRCLCEGFNEPAAGLFVDQKWANLFPALSERVGVIRNKGWNVAYWNLFERDLTHDGQRWLVNGEEGLVFFHFSGFKWKAPDRITDHTESLYTGGKAFEGLFTEYAANCAKAASEAPGARSSYSFGAFRSGELIPELARRLAIGWRHAQPSVNPFSLTGEWKKFLSDAGCLVSAKQVHGVPKTPRAMNRQDRRIRALNVLLRALSKLAGADRYTLLMKYLTHLNIGRNQNFVFFPQLPHVEIVLAREETAKSAKPQG